MWIKDKQGREWFKSVNSATKGMKFRCLTAEENEAIKALTFEAHELLKGLVFPDSVENAAYEATTGPYNKFMYRYMGFDAFYAIRRLTTARSTVRKIAGDDQNVTIRLTAILKEMKAITGTAPKGL